jgi:general secretion pathway protein D
MKFSYMAALSVLVLLPTLSLAQESEPKSATSISAGSHAGDTDLRAFLKEVGARMHKHFVLDPRAPQMIDLGGFPHQELTFAQLLSILDLNGLIVVADEGLAKVIRSSDVRQEPLPLVEPDNIKTLGDEVVICVVPIKNIGAAQLVPVIRPLLPTWAHLAALVDRNALIIVDRSANVRLLVQIIKELEKLPKAPDTPVAKVP